MTEDWVYFGINKSDGSAKGNFFPRGIEGFRFKIKIKQENL